MLFQSQIKGGYSVTENTKHQILKTIETSKNEILSYPDYDQLITVKTIKSNMYSFANKIECMNAHYEEDFINQLIRQEDFEIEYVVCVWNDGSLDIPSMNFRQLLLQASEKNNHAILVMLGENGIIGRELASCMPICNSNSKCV